MCRELTAVCGSGIVQLSSSSPRYGPKRSPDSRSVQNTPTQTKKRRSEEREAKDESMPPQQLEAAMNVAITSEIDSKIHDIVEDIRDFKDQMKASRNQLAYLLYQEADKQRAEAAGKIMVKIGGSSQRLTTMAFSASTGRTSFNGLPRKQASTPKTLANFTMNTDEEDQFSHLPWCMLAPTTTSRS